jgi:hypothetical protein
MYIYKYIYIHIYTYTLKSTCCNVNAYPCFLTLKFRSFSNIIKGNPFLWRERAIYDDGYNSNDDDEDGDDGSDNGYDDNDNVVMMMMMVVVVVVMKFRSFSSITKGNLFLWRESAIYEYIYINN